MLLFPTRVTSPLPEAAKASRRSNHGPLNFYTAIVRPVLEYAFPVWHSGLIAGQCNAIENIQKRAIRVIYFDTDGDYEIALIVARID